MAGQFGGKLLAGVVGAVALGLTGALAVPAQAESAFTLTLDDFEGYADTAALNSAYARNTSGGGNTVTLEPSPFGAGQGNAMRLAYQFRSGYSGRTLALPNAYWPGLEQVELWIQDDAAGQDILLQFLDGASYECHLRDLPQFDPTSTAPQHLAIPIGEFKPKEGTGTLDPTRITTFGIYVNQVGGAAGGAVVVDGIKLGFAAQPVLPSV
jgi:hypothetical protein